MNGYLMMQAPASQSPLLSQQGAINWTFYREYLHGALSRLVARLSGRDSRLLDLEQVSRDQMVRGSHEAGIRTVALSQIRGSQGRSQDFDRRFRPLQQHTRSRWESVARAWANGLPLPPVELVQVGESYFVRDGHHRISVARSMGQESIEARVVVLEFEASNS